MRAGSLFTGIGGLDLGVNAALGCDTAWMCEYDKHCQRVLAERFPGVPVLPDVRDTDALAAAGPVDILHGGYPCQPFSHAGVRRGEDDPRHLWPSFARAIRVLRPSIVVLENVAGHLTLGFDTVLGDLAEMGFSARWGVVRASDAGAPHQRARLFVLAYASGAGAWGNGGEILGAQEPGRIESQADIGSVDAFRAALADSGGERHGPRQDTRGVGCVDSRDAGQARERERPRTVASDRSATPAADAERERGRTQHKRYERLPDAQWGAYAPAITRWELITGRPAPRPTDDRGGLMPEFTEWMMGFPIGWTASASRTQRLKMCGNAVVPAQAEYAIRLLTA